ncbi:hypothetical protein D9758_003359 [Tetrapyrgos nigripes]|uniref:HECT-like ubiquitin-conjugating enzyme-binding-domain-containing protein n=1 Tax=Tetrapyrgos nigripes TaxID=182062 RepID=A0A8H5LVL8_9AGAR|nr:hypothetical protein D9758_003359 [Tetrapyrgos nigripes]
MATLTRARVDDAQPIDSLSDSIPTPFPREFLRVDSTSHVPAQSEQVRELEASPSTQEASETVSSGTLHELMPSIFNVERSCLMALNNLLSAPSKWKTIVPDRRHSMPSSPAVSTNPHAEAESSSSALQTLVSNLRNREGAREMIEAPSFGTDAQLIHELSLRVEGITSTLDPSDALLAKTLITLLSHLNRLATIVDPSSPAPSRVSATQSDLWSTELTEPTEPVNLFDTLKRQLSDFQIERQTSNHEVLTRGSTPVVTVEASLLWSGIDEELENVVSLCRERTASASAYAADVLPPRYDPGDYKFDDLPDYEQPVLSHDDEKYHSLSQTAHSPIVASSTNEKRRLDLEAVTMAIDRLYLVAPQLHNQRVELKSSKLEQMEKARREGTRGTSSKAAGKQKQTDADVRDLESMLELINKASDRKLLDQSVVLNGGLKLRMEKARMRDQAKATFVEQLAEHSNARRLHGQDATQRTSRIKNPETMLSLPEFIREAVPPENLKIDDPTAMLTLPEFVREIPPSNMILPPTTVSPPVPSSPPSGALARLAFKRKNRDRSNSAPPLAWLRGSTSKSNIATDAMKQSDFLSGIGPSRTVFDVTYVAENQENLQHILVFFTVTGAQPGIDLEAEVQPSFSDTENLAETGYRLVIKSGPNTSLPLILPGRVAPGKKEIKVQSGHFEIKLPTLSSPSTSNFNPDPFAEPEPQREPEASPLLDATQLTSTSPTSFICASCSLPLVQSAKISQYNDLPSEHWEELVDAWMCHSSQKLNEDVAKRGKNGFWPDPGQALVGGSYILFEESAMAKDNFNIPEDSKRPRVKGARKTTLHSDSRRIVRCLCGAFLGRCQDRETEGKKIAAYRILKYAVRPVSQTAEPSKIPLSAFIVEDMNEFVQAHASYRFVISDEEDERPRILANILLYQIWLFKPSIQVAYATPRHYTLPKSASMNAAKVLYKLLGPSERSLDLKTVVNSYPGFPQAEYLYYPMDTCQRLAVLLKESNRTYPESMRIMTNLEVGWLQRS